MRTTTPQAAIAFRIDLKHATPLEFDDIMNLDYKHSIPSGIMSAINSSHMKKLAPHRAWLLQFFAALERKEGREAILAGLKEVRESF